MIIKIIRKFFKVESKTETRDDAFVWELAEALMWRDECVSCAVIPSPIKEQPDANRYYDDALYLINFVTQKHEEDNDNIGGVI